MKQNRNYTRLYLALSLMAALTLSLSGCGGGGGGGGGGTPSGCVGKVTPPGSPLLATITGIIYDTGHNVVNNASISVNVPGGTSISATTDCTGKFVVTNVPLSATTFTVASPDPVAYYNYANYNGKLYDLIACTLPLPKLNAGANSPFTEIDLYVGGTSPPPPPPAGGCPS